MTGTIFETIKKALETEGGISQDVRDMLILSGIISLYGELDRINREVQEIRKVVPMYKVLIFIGGILVSLIAGFLWGIFTGQISVKF